MNNELEQLREENQRLREKLEALLAVLPDTRKLLIAREDAAATLKREL